MRLLVTKPSPYARKAWAAVIELGLAQRVAVEELPARMPTVPKPDVDLHNPLGKVPVLVAEGGAAIVDSRVIVAFLDAMAGGGRLIAVGPERFAALTLEALADGLCDCGVVVRVESLKPEAQRSAEEIAAYTAKIERTLDRIAAEPPAGAFNVGQLALVCALDWLAFRALVPDPLATRPALAAWHAGLRDRSSLAATRP